MKILTIDPSGTGTSGLCLINKKKIEFQEFYGKNWKEHLRFVIQLVKEYQPNVIIYEDTNYIHRKTKDGLSLFRFLGILEGLEYIFDFIEKIEKVNVLPVKKLSKELLKGTKKITNFEYQRGRGKGWMYQGKRISVHCLEAYLIYHLSSFDSHENN